MLALNLRTCSLHENSFPRDEPLRLHLSSRLADRIAPGVDLLSESVQLRAFQNSRLDPGNVDGRVHLVKGTSDQAKPGDQLWQQIRSVRLTTRLS